MQGDWIHEQDSLAVVEIRGNEWTFKYLGSEPGELDKYDIMVVDTLTPFVDKNVKADFIILSNSEDELHYEIMTLTPEIMSLMYYPRGNTHVYKSKVICDESIEIFAV